MISVRKQEFIEMFLPGVVYLIIGISGCLIKSNYLNLIAFILMAGYSFYVFTKKSIKKEKDDDDSKQNKNRAGYFTFHLILIAVTLYLAFMIIVGGFNGNGFYTIVTMDLNALCIALGTIQIIYYLAFSYFDRTE